VANLFSIIFTDNSTYEGGTLEHTGWREIPNKKIRSLYYLLPSGDYLCLREYDRYYQYIEATQDIYGSHTSSVKLEYAYIMGKRGNKVTVYKIDLTNSAIMKQDFDEEDGFIKRLNSDFWK